MSKKLRCYVLDRKTLDIKQWYVCRLWEINRDYLTNEKSFFAYPGGAARQGDFFVAKDEGAAGGTANIDGNEKEGFRPLYLGVIDAFEGDGLLACDLYNLANFEFPARRTSGPDIAAHLKALLVSYLLNDPSKAVGLDDIHTGSEVMPHAYQPQESPTATNLVAYLVNAFSKYGAVWDCEWVYLEGGALKIYSAVRVMPLAAPALNIKNNSYAFVNWSVYYTPAALQTENKLDIYAKGDAALLSTWYVTADGEITQSLDGVYLPTKTRVYVYDQDEDDPPTYQEVARSELAASQYSHEINVSLHLGNRVVPFDGLRIGQVANIVHDGSLYRSILTGYVLNSDNEFAELRFGNVRSTLQAALNGRK
jgi:hypothetical protein